MEKFLIQVKETLLTKKVWSWGGVQIKKRERDHWLITKRVLTSLVKLFSY